MIRTEMQQWVSGYAPQRYNQASIRHHLPTLIITPGYLVSLLSFFNMSNTKCKEVRQAILDSHFN